MTAMPPSTGINFIPAALLIPDVTDHAVLRYLQRVMGFDVEAVRTMISGIVAGPVGIGASAFSSGGVTYKFDHNRVVTVLPNQKPSEMATGAMRARGEQPRKSAHNRREAHQMIRRRK